MIVTKKILITGPECSGKTSLWKELIHRYPGSKGVPEFSRYYLKLLGKNYSQSDILQIGKGQFALELTCEGLSPNYLFIDTSFLVLKIWSEYKYGTVDQWIQDKFAHHHYDLCILCKPDFPWEFDPQRESPQERWTLYNMYKAQLIKHQKNYIELAGELNERLQKVKPILANLGKT